LEFAPPGCNHRQAAAVALARSDSPDTEWVGGLRLLWSKPPTVLELSAGTESLATGKVDVGDLLVRIQGQDISTATRAEVLKLIIAGGQMALEDGNYESKFRASAAIALERPQSDPEWIGPFQFTWSSWPRLLEVLPAGHSHVQQEVGQRDLLLSVDGCELQTGEREDVLRKFMYSKGQLSFASGRFERDLRDAAAMALSNSDGIANQLGPITLHWTKPPTVLWIADYAQNYFRCPLRPGDQLIQVNGEALNAATRQRVLSLLSEFDGRLQTVRHRKGCLRLVWNKIISQCWPSRGKSNGRAPLSPLLVGGEA